MEDVLFFEKCFTLSKIGDRNNIQAVNTGLCVGNINMFQRSTMELSMSSIFLVFCNTCLPIFPAFQGLSPKCHFFASFFSLNEMQVLHFTCPVVLMHHLCVKYSCLNSILNYFLMEMKGISKAPEPPCEVYWENHFCSFYSYISRFQVRCGLYPAGPD
jgi:hypothetical protein